MKTKSKALLMMLCAVLLVAASVLGTMAYLTATTGTVNNTFTVGNVSLDGGKNGAGLDEAEVDEYGVVVDEDADRVLGNKYKLVPGHEYKKDPTVHVNPASESCWVFVKVENGLTDGDTSIEGENTISEQIAENGWTELEDGIYYKAWNDKNNADLVVFESFCINGDLEATDLEAYANAEITVKAFAIQKDGFDEVADAWDAVKEEYPEDTAA